MSQNGKGSKPRPYSVDHEVYASNWDLVFKKKDKEKQKEESQKEQSDNASDNKSS